MSEKLTPVVGKWALVRSSYDGVMSPDVYEISKVMKATFSAAGRWARDRIPYDDLMALFDSEDDANKAAQSIAGIRGERDRRINAARNAAREQVLKLLVRSGDHHDA